MISRIDLGNYGRFDDASFDLGPVTVFLGPNESGKSTIFDALFESLCNPPGTITRAKNVASRYGAGRRAVAQGVLPPPELTSEEFFSVLAVDSGAIEIPATDRGDWVERVKAHFFSDGVDPMVLAAELRKEASERQSARHMKKLNGLVDKRTEVAGRLDDARGRRRAMLQRRREGEEASRRVISVSQKLQEVHQKRADAERRLSSLEQQSRRRQLLQALSVCRELRSVEDALTEAGELREASVGELRELQKRVVEVTRDAAEHQRAVDELQRRIEREAEEALEVEGQILRIRRHIPLAQQLRKELGADRRPPRTRGVTAAIVAALIAVGVGAAAGAILLPPPLAYLTASGGAFVALVLVLLLLRRPKVSIAEIKDRWVAATGEFLLSEGVDGLLRELSGPESVAQHLDSRLSAVHSRKAELSAERERVEGGRGESRRRVQEAERALAEKLRHHDVATVEDLEKQLRRRGEREQRRDLYRRQLAPWQEELGVEELPLLEEELRLQAHAIEDVSLVAGSSEQDIQSIRRHKSELTAAQEKLETEHRELKTEAESALRAFSAIFAGLPEEILSLERDLAEVDAAIEELQRRRRGAAIAASIFEALAADASQQLEELGAEVGDLFGAITAGNGPVGLESLDGTTAEARDALGVRRKVSALSQGTREVLAWSLRLALAGRARPQGAILVLDDPFLSVDQTRRKGCVNLLRPMLTRRWQVVLLTKDSELAEEMASLSKESVVHRLER